MLQEYSDWIISQPLFISVIFSIMAFIFTSISIPLAIPVFIKQSLCGKDLLKKDKPIIAESMGAIVGCIYFVFMFLFIPVPFLEWVRYGKYIHGEHPEFPHDKFSQYLGGLLSLFSMLFLGFADDVLDIRWRIKIWFPFIASIPLLMVYYVTHGGTDVLIPIPFRFIFSTPIINLGGLYYFILSMIATFSTNSINILAGVNGVEGIQALIIAISLAMNSITIFFLNPARSDAMHTSLYFLLPYIGCMFGYLRYNWYPAKVFGGDTICYFSGMVFAVIGISCNLSKTVLLFMIPQLFNFLLSCPQLFKFVNCPRHRMPKLCKDQINIQYSKFEFKPCQTFKDRMGRWMIQLLEILKLVQITKTDKGDWIDCSNLTILNLILIKTGPIREDQLVIYLSWIQITCAILAFIIRYGLVHIVYNENGI
ncbi:glycosyl transferase family 4-domain-containing protein [Globomyces pollinis-pini]|nr:glycosyl transferase family 4-domain-containing protein [Globomyces pollinis-pini]